MVCDKCEHNKELGYTFCPDCGNPLKEGCVYCAQYEKEGYEFCGKCGRPLNPRRYDQPQQPGPTKMAALAAMPFIVILLILAVAAMVYGFMPAFEYLEDKTLGIIMLIPSVTSIGTLHGAQLQAFWVGIFVTILASVALILFQSKAMFKPRKDGDTSQAERTPFYWICLLFVSCFVLNIVISLIAILISGEPFEIPDQIAGMSFPQAVFEMAEASVWEEVIGRMLPIGIPMVIMAFCHGRKDGLRYILGGFGTSRLVWALIILTAVVFGYAHVGGWGWLKFLPAMISGLAMGYLYCRFGIHASIMFHFMSDYIFVISMLGDIGAMLLSGLMLLFLVIGGLGLATVYRKITEGAREVRNMDPTGFGPAGFRK